MWSLNSISNDDPARNINVPTSTSFAFLTPSFRGDRISHLTSAVGRQQVSVQLVLSVHRIALLIDSRQELAMKLLTYVHYSSIAQTNTLTYL